MKTYSKDDVLAMAAFIEDRTLMANDCRNVSAAMLRAFAQTLGEPVAVPEGWKLVPIEPCWDQRNEGRELLIDGLENDPERMAYVIYKAMLSAAPHHQTTEKGCE